ncbi:MAG TPA: alkaline phosphatase family protein [Actinospica sp.]|nr:alkaline phosphatase family protein [Actinospica sp.]
MDVHAQREFAAAEADMSASADVSASADAAAIADAVTDAAADGHRDGPAVQPVATSARTRRVLVVGIDGVRLDLLDRVAAPRLARLRAAGFLAPVRVDAQTPTMSGPCWATIATGVHVGKHGVWSNDFSGHRLNVFPDFATRLARGHGRKTFVAAGWDPLVLARDGGPLFAAPTRLLYVAPDAHTAEAWERVDEEVTVDAEAVLRRDPVDAAFVYLGAADETAHLHGCGERYLTSIENADARLGRLLDALRAREAYEQEDWTVIAVTDHGHADEGGHGGRSDLERTAWIAAAGPDLVPGVTPSRELRHVDVAAHVFKALDLVPDRHWTFDGAHFATADAPAAGPGPVAGRAVDPVTGPVVGPRADPLASSPAGNYRAGQEAATV